MGTTIILTEILKQFVELQIKLMAVFKEGHQHLSDWKFLLDFPNSGELEIDGESWSFNKHGSGLLFRNNQTGLVVDIHKDISNPYQFDSWKLEQFIESSKYNVDVDTLDNELKNLSDNDVIIEDSEKKGVFELIS